MAIPEGKERRFVTLTHEEWEYLEKRIAHEKQKHSTLRKKGPITSSTILSELISADMKIKQAFGDDA